jgi:hypothetical protein
MVTLKKMYHVSNWKKRSYHHKVNRSDAGPAALLLLLLLYCSRLISFRSAFYHHHHHHRRLSLISFRLSSILLGSSSVITLALISLISFLRPTNTVQRVPEKMRSLPISSEKRRDSRLLLLLNAPSSCSDGNSCVMVEQLAGHIEPSYYMYS